MALMARLVRVVVAVALTPLAATAAPQGGPDFTGRWTEVPEPAATGGGRGGVVGPGTMGSGWGAEFTIKQDAATLVVDRALFQPQDMQPPMRFSYTLDGSPSRNVINMGRGPQELVSRAVWQGASLVITTRYRFSHPRSGEAETSEVRQVLSLDASGSLVIAATRSGALGGPHSTSTTTFKKSD